MTTKSRISDTTTQYIALGVAISFPSDKVEWSVPRAVRYKVMCYLLVLYKVPGIPPYIILIALPRYLRRNLGKLGNAY